MKLFESLTKHIHTLKEGPFDESAGLGYVEYSKAVDDFITDLYDFCDAHLEFECKSYMSIVDETCNKFGVEYIHDIDASKLDSKSIIAFLVFAIRGDRFCEGLLMGFLEGGDIVRWLERLKEIDEIA